LLVAGYWLLVVITGQSKGPAQAEPFQNNAPG